MQTAFEPTSWFWLIVGLGLLGLEVLLPGMIVMWFGFGAIMTGFILALFPSLSLATQLILFAVLSVGSLIAWRNSKWREERIHSDTPELNQRLQNLMGKEFVLTEAIQNGRGTIRVGDTPWIVEGPDLPAGAKVRVTQLDGMILRVETV